MLGVPSGSAKVHIGSEPVIANRRERMTGCPEVVAGQKSACRKFHYINALVVIDGPIPGLSAGRK